MPQPNDIVRPRKRGRKRTLSEEAILDAAVAVLTADGLEAVTIRRIASDLGVTPMTLYSYFATKDHLLEALAGRIISQALPKRRSSAPWDEQTTRVMRRMHDVLRDHPGVGELILTRHLRGPNLDDIRNHVLALLNEAGLDPTQTIDGLRLLSIYVIASAVAETAREPEVAIDVDPARLPALAHVADRYENRSRGAAFEFGLEQIMNSLRALAAKRHRPGL